VMVSHFQTEAVSSGQPNRDYAPDAVRIDAFQIR